jgi:hypothetical protein
MLHNFLLLFSSILYAFLPTRLLLSAPTKKVPPASLLPHKQTTGKPKNSNRWAPNGLSSSPRDSFEEESHFVFF